ncbi:MAG: Diaminohydroxyphosphoribosylaminopyrimidine deaminase / 5-amino-6-(5-phosphoribosylamino)uracil reductase, partial [uncultured Solirubrobacteraceae bacterium]
AAHPHGSRAPRPHARAGPAGPGQRPSQPRRRRRGGPRRGGARRGLARGLRRPARRGQRDRRLRRGRPARGHDLRLARAVLPPGQDAPVHGRDPRGGHRAGGGRLGRPDGEGVRPGPGDPARRGRGGGRGRRRARRGRPAAQPGLPQARADGAPVGAVQVRDVARRQGGHGAGRLEVDLLRGLPRAGPPLARERGRRRGRHRHRAGRRPAAHRAPARGDAPAPARRLRLHGAPAPGLPARPRHGRRAAHRGDLPGRAAHRRGRAGDGGRRHRGGHGPERARPGALRARAARRSRGRLPAARGRPPAGGRLPGRRRGRRGPLLPRAHPPRRPRRPRPARGRGRGADRRRRAGPDAELLALGRGRPAHRAPAGVV